MSAASQSGRSPAKHEPAPRHRREFQQPANPRPWSRCGSLRSDGGRRLGRSAERASRPPPLRSGAPPRSARRRCAWPDLPPKPTRLRRIRCQSGAVSASPNAGGAQSASRPSHFPPGTRPSVAGRGKTCWRIREAAGPGTSRRSAYLPLVQAQPGGRLPSRCLRRSRQAAVSSSERARPPTMPPAMIGRADAPLPAGRPRAHLGHEQPSILHSAPLHHAGCHEPLRHSPCGGPGYRRRGRCRRTPCPRPPGKVICCRACPGRNGALGYLGSNVMLIWSARSGGGIASRTPWSRKRRFDRPIAPKRRG